MSILSSKTVADFNVIQSNIALCLQEFPQAKGYNRPYVPFLVLIRTQYSIALHLTSQHPTALSAGPCGMCYVHCVLYSANCVLYSVHCVLYSVHCVLYNVHCTMCLGGLCPRAVN